MTPQEKEKDRDAINRKIVKTLFVYAVRLSISISTTIGPILRQHHMVIQGYHSLVPYGCLPFKIVC